MEDPGSQEILLEVILLIVLTLLNAFFSATEMSNGIVESLSCRAKG